MRIFFGFMAVAVLLVGGWVLMPRASGTGEDAQADAFAADAMSQLYSTSPQGQTPAPQGNTQGAITSDKPAGTITSQDKKFMYATLHTNQGDIKIEFFASDAPNTVANFQKLASEGFYNGTKFHRVIADFMIQGGDPLSKDDSMADRWGTGGPGYKFADEIRANNKNDTGTISMANAGANTNGSQFFINVANNNFLDGKHTTFGKVIDGMDVVARIENAPTGANDRPVSPMVVESITLE